MTTKERPILFSGPMVRAIRDGRKTQTRRVCRNNGEPGPERIWGVGDCKYGSPGDRLWVKETWFPSPVGQPASNVKIPKALPDGWTVLYAASGDTISKPLHWKPSIFMPRWASRLTLEITAVMVERLQDISMSDVFAEGCILSTSKSDPIDFQNLWDSINGKTYPWSSNPFVWVISFKTL